MVEFVKGMVSVIIPSYNHAQYIEQTVKSVLEQDYTNWELIICDDGSKDKSHEILQKYNDDRRITLILHETNRGQGVVLNEGIDIAKGEFICFLSSDDLYYPERLRLLVEKLNSTNRGVGFVYSYGHSMDTKGNVKLDQTLKVLTGNIFNKLILGNCIFPISPMFRREVFAKERFWDGYAAEGEAIYVRIARHWSVEFVPIVTCAMRKHSYNTGANVEVMYVENIKWLNQFISTPDLSREEKALVNKRIGFIHRLSGLSYIRLKKDYHKGNDALKACIIQNKLYIFDWKVVAGLVICAIMTRRVDN